MSLPTTKPKIGLCLVHEGWGWGFSGVVIEYVRHKSVVVQRRLSDGLVLFFFLYQEAMCIYCDYEVEIKHAVHLIHFCHLLLARN